MSDSKDEIQGWSNYPWEGWVTPHWNDPKFHVNKHPMMLDRWNPYRERESTSSLSEEFFRAQNFTHNGVHTSPSFAFFGCLDAPEYIPLGSTQRVKTVGDYEREEYSKGNRECTDYRASLRAQAEVGKMLRRILAEVDGK